MAFTPPSISIDLVTPPKEGNPIVHIFNQAISLLILLAGIAATFYVMWAGYKYIAASTPDDSKKARQALVSGIIGVIIVTLAYSIIRLAVGIGASLPTP